MKSPRCSSSVVALVAVCWYGEVVGTTILYSIILFAHLNPTGVQFLLQFNVLSKHCVAFSLPQYAYNTLFKFPESLLSISVEWKMKCTIKQTNGLALIKNLKALRIKYNSDNCICGAACGRIWRIVTCLPQSFKLQASCTNKKVLHYWHMPGDLEAIHENLGHSHFLAITRFTSSSTHTQWMTNVNSTAVWVILLWQM